MYIYDHLVVSKQNMMAKITKQATWKDKEQPQEDRKNTKKQENFKEALLAFLLGE